MSCFYSEAATNPSRPNIILILTDDQGYNDLGCFGSDRIKTPNIDRMAAEGMKFADFYVTAPICTPARASIMTGCYPSRVGLGTPLHTPDTIGLHEDEITLADLLKSQGYATACVGKWHLGHHPKFYPTRHGFDYYYGTPLGHCFATEGMRTKGKYSALFLRNEEKVPFPPIEELTEALTAEAVQWIKANEDNPFFLFMSHPMPHGPVAASERFRGKSAGGLYGDAIEEIDWSTGEILKTINELGLALDTIVVFTSDNGACTNPWGVDATWFGSNAPFRGKKQQCWEGGLRVPCVMWGPGRFPAGSVCTELATVMDFLPTFAGMAGAELPTDRLIDGKDITALMSGQPDAKSPYDAFIFHARLGKRSGIRVGDWKLLVETDAITWKHQGDALYDLKNDLGEHHNVAAERPDKVKRLKARLRAFEEELSQTSRRAGSLVSPVDDDDVTGNWMTEVYFMRLDNILSEPDEVKAVAAKLTDFFIGCGRLQLAHIPDFHGGIGSFYYSMWAPRGTVWHQEDAAALLSPDLYAEFIEPCDGKIAAAFEGCIIHQHPTGFYPVDAYLEMDMTALELHIDEGGPSTEELFDVHKKILARKPLLIWGDIPEQDLDWIFSRLPVQGLAVNTVVTSPEQAEALWRRYVG